MCMREREEEELLSFVGLPHRSFCSHDHSRTTRPHDSHMTSPASSTEYLAIHFLGGYGVGGGQSELLLT